jgi:hypothetical protein
MDSGHSLVLRKGRASRARIVTQQSASQGKVYHATVTERLKKMLSNMLSAPWMAFCPGGQAMAYAVHRDFGRQAP